MSHKFIQRPNRFATVVFSLVSLLSLTGAGISPARSNSAIPSMPQTVDPTPTYAITYTATGTGFSDVTDAYGTRSVKKRKITMAGSGIWRTYAAGGWDYSPYDLTVTDDFDQVDTTPCSGQGGSERDHQTFSVTDPNRYSGGPVHDFPLILSPLQRLDGTWYMSDPFSGFYVNRFFNYRYDSDYINCWGEVRRGTADVNRGHRPL